MVNLTKLREIYLSGNPLEGCIPQGLSGVGRNDLFSLGLQFCNIPDAPTITAPMIAGPGSLTVAWTAPAVGPSVVAYDLRYIRTDADDIVNANWTLAEEVWAIGFNPLEYVLTGLAAPTQYNVQMRAVNAAGNGPWSATVVGPPSAWGAIRSVSSAYVEPGDEVQVTITVTGYGESGRVVETLPPGFSYVSSDLDDDAVIVIGQKVILFLVGEEKFTYTVEASTVGWGYRFIGYISNDHELQHLVGGASRIRIEAAPAVYVVCNTSTLVRPNSPMPVTATFSEPVFGFTIEGIDAVNGVVSKFAGNSVDGVYTGDQGFRWEETSSTGCNTETRLQSSSQETHHCRESQYSDTPLANEVDGGYGTPKAAGAATDADGYGNMAALTLSLGIPYDDDGTPG